MKYLVYLFLFLFSSEVSAYPSGAPTSKCASMRPGHFGEPQSMATLPYEVTISKAEYSLGEKLKVTLKPKGGKNLKGFLIQARKAGTGLSVSSAFGSFSTSGNGKTISCFGGTNNAATHNSKYAKSEVILDWTAPTETDDLHDLIFRVTFVESFSTFWVGSASSILQVKRSAPDPTTGAPPQTTTHGQADHTTGEAPKTQPTMNNMTGSHHESSSIGTTQPESCPGMCTEDYTPVCDNEGYTHSNHCKFLRAACEAKQEGRIIYVVSRGECKDPATAAAERSSRLQPVTILSSVAFILCSGWNIV